MKKKLLLMLLTLLIIISATGCTAEIYQRMIIKGVGVDKTDKGYKVSVRHATLKEDYSEELTVVEGETLYEALSNLSLITGKQQMYSSASYVIYGKEAAKDGIDKAIDFFIRYFKARPTISVYVAADTAEDILKTKNKDDKLIQSYQIKSFTENSENKGKTVSTTALSFIADLKRQGGGTIVPLIEKKGDELSCTKSVLFNGYKMGEIMNEDETEGYLSSRGKAKNGSYVLKSESGNKLTVEIMGTSAKSTLKMNEGKPEFNISVKVDAMLASIPISDSTTGYDEIEKLITAKVKNNVKKAVKKCQKSKTDVHDFGYMLYTKETEYWKKSEEKWNDEYSKAKINVDVKTELTRIGEEDKPPH